LVFGDDGDDGEERAGRFPALGAPTCVVVGYVSFQGDFDGILLAMTMQFPTREGGIALLDTVVKKRVEGQRHGVFACSMTVFS
jgi:hypothetical protein